MLIHKEIAYKSTFKYLDVDLGLSSKKEISLPVILFVLV